MKIDNNIPEVARRQIEHIAEVCERIKPLVVIRCATYNHEPFIRDALEGFVMQKTDFPFVALVFEDASTDGTAAVVRKYAERYPDIILPIFEDENQYSKHDGSLRRITTVATEATDAKYIAWCEGDDYWTDPQKLQKQVDLLDAHPDCVLVHTDFDRKNVLTGKLEHAVWKHSRNYNQIDRQWGEQLAGLMVEGLYSCLTLTCMVRVSAILKAEEEKARVTNKNLLMGDTNLWMLLSCQGNVHLIPEVTATYRIIAESATHSRDFSRVITFYSSCIDMVNAYTQYLHIKEHGKRAIQTYIYFLLKEIYLNKTEYLPRINEEVVREESLSWYNNLLESTIRQPSLIKRLIFVFVKTILKMRQDWRFLKAKYFGII